MKGLTTFSTAVLMGLIILLVGVRFFQLGSLPVILNRDEAALAYNAYLLQQTGVDEWGRSWPVVLESFGDFKLPGYSWWLVGLFTVFGHHDWVVRLPAAIAGIWLAVMAGVITKTWKWSKSEQILALGLVGLSPVFIFYSRMAWEATLSLALGLTGWYCIWLDSSRGWKRQIMDVVGVLAWALAIFTYNIPFIVLPCLIPTLLIYRHWKKYQDWILPMVGLVLVWIVSASLFIPLTSQKSSITLFSDPTTYAEWISYRSQPGGMMQHVLGNRYVYLGVKVSERLLSTFSPSFLVFQGGSHPWHQVPGTGHIFLITYGLGLLGLLTMVVSLLRLSWQRQWQAILKSPDTFLLYCLGISLIPAVITVDAPHATRSLLFFFWFVLMAVRGWSWVRLQLGKGNQPQLKSIGLTLLSIGLLLELSLYLQAYFGQYPSDQNAFKPGYNQALETIDQQYPGKEVAIVDPNGYDYILVAWYLKMNPTEYFSTTIRQQPDRIGFRYGQQVGKYHFVAHADDREARESVVLEWQQDHWQITYQP